MTQYSLFDAPPSRRAEPMAPHRGRPRQAWQDIPRRPSATQIAKAEALRAPVPVARVDYAGLFEEVLVPDDTLVDPQWWLDYLERLYARASAT